MTPPEGVEEAVELLRAGEVVGLPTETVYGLGADALDAFACARIFEAKQRPLSDPLIVHVPDAGWVERLGRSNTLAAQLAEAFWPGPLTMVLPRRDPVPDIVTAGEDTVALRWSANPIFQAVASKFGGPIAAPSANRFGRISPTSAEDVQQELGSSIALIVDGGRCSHGIESTIVLVRDKGLEILRHGPVTAEELSAFGRILEADSGVSAPGRMKSHYAPRTRLVISPSPTNPEAAPQVVDGDLLGRVGVQVREELKAKAGFISWSSPGEGYAQVEYLSKTQDLREAAANLYGAMRRLDEAGLALIVVEEVPMTGLGVAIMERLGKAAAR